MGEPFVGPAGQLLHKALAESGLDRRRVYLTNAVKHFKWGPRGTRRLHEKPNTAEVLACQLWLELELQALAPRLVIALGATAARSLLGPGGRVLRDRGTTIAREGGLPCWSRCTRPPSSARRTTPRERRRSAPSSPTCGPPRECSPGRDAHGDHATAPLPSRTRQRLATSHASTGSARSRTHHHGHRFATTRIQNADERPVRGRAGFELGDAADTARNASPSWLPGGLAFVVHPALRCLAVEATPSTSPHAGRPRSSVGRSPRSCIRCWSRGSSRTAAGRSRGTPSRTSTRRAAAPTGRAARRCTTPPAPCPRRSS